MSLGALAYTWTGLTAARAQKLAQVRLADRARALLGADLSSEALRDAAIAELLAAKEQNPGPVINAGLVNGMSASEVTDRFSEKVTELQAEGRGILEIGPGFFTFNASPPAWTAGDFTVRGQYANATNLIMGASGLTMFDLSGGLVERFCIENLWIGSLAARAAGYGIKILGTAATHSHNVQIKHVTLQNVPNPFYAQYTDDMLVDGMEIICSLASGIPTHAYYLQDVLGSRHFDVVIRGIGHDITGDGFNIDTDVDSNYFYGCLAEYCTGVAWRFHKTTSGDSGPRISKMYGCSGESSVAACVVSEGRDLEFFGFNGNVCDESGIVVTGGDAITFYGPWTQTNNHHGINLAGGNGALVRPESHNNGQATDLTYSGIVIAASVAEGWEIVGGRALDNLLAVSANRHLAGLSIGASTDKVNLVGCVEANFKGQSGTGIANQTAGASSYRTVTIRGRGISATRGDQDVTLNASDVGIQRFATELTDNRTITLPTLPDSGLPPGSSFKVTRDAATPGNFTLAIGTIITLPANQKAWGEVTVSDAGSAWVATGYGVFP